ncbi:MAG: DUF3619 family protein [Hylemonella sp.]|nr:DUF3619 family protein [Hylemonella sp.]
MTTQAEARFTMLEAQFASKVVARLAQGAESVPHDISERLRVARMQAVAQRKKPLAQTQLTTSPAIEVAGSAAIFGIGGGLGDEKSSIFNRLASFLPIAALLIGLIAVNHIQNDDRANELAEVDSALLTDDLPPAAYVDPGFVHFLKITQNVSP